MKKDFYKDRLTEKHSIEVIVPNDKDGDLVHKIICNELCLGNIKDSSKQEYIRIIEKMAKDGEYARGYFSCNETPLLINEGDISTPIFDTTTIRVERANL
jgi:aspartate racemase